MLTKSTLFSSSFSKIRSHFLLICLQVRIYKIQTKLTLLSSHSYLFRDPVFIGTQCIFLRKRRRVMSHAGCVQHRNCKIVRLSDCGGFLH